jgi:hypothetical protein
MTPICYHPRSVGENHLSNVDYRILIQGFGRDTRECHNHYRHESTWEARVNFKELEAYDASKFTLDGGWEPIQIGSMCQFDEYIINSVQLL